MDKNLSSQAYRELINQTADILTVVDESGIILWESPAVPRVVGYEQDELIGEPVFEYIHPEDREEALQKLLEAIERDDDPELKTLEFRFQHKDGSWVWLEARGETERADGLDGYVMSSRDITERKEYEQSLKRERDRLDRLTSIVSHDLRNPLSVISGRLELAQEDCQSEHLDAMARSVNRMSEIIDDLLTLTREGGTDPVLEAVTIQDIGERCWQNVATKAATLNIKTDQTVMADERRFQQVFENFFRNAVEHGGQDVTITVGALDDGFYVEDDGSGIPEDARDSLFDYGFSTKTDGTGFGLSIVNEIVRNHDWSLNVAEGQDGGARFEITGVEIVAE